MTRRRVPKEDKPIPAEIMDGWLRGWSEPEIATLIDVWRSRGLSEAEILRAMSMCNDAFTFPAHGDLISSVVSPVLDLQRQVGKELVDWTWAEALEAFMEARRRNLDEAIELGRQFGEVDPDREMSIRHRLRAMVADDGEPVTIADWILEYAKRRILKVLRRARELYDEWSKIRKSGLRGQLLKAYRARVSGYYHGDEASMREETTERARQKAKTLKRELDKDPYVVELRAELRIHADGFQDEDQAAGWLYDRYPAIKDLAPYGPDFSMHEYGPREIPRPPIIQVSVLAEATRRLRKRHEEEHEVKLEPEWDFLLCFYLLRGELDPLPRKIVDRKRPKREKHQRICELSNKYKHAFKVAMYYNYGLTDADWTEIGQNEPAAKRNWITQDAKVDIEEEAEKIAKRKGTLRPENERIDEIYVRQVRHRMRAERKA